MTKSVIMVWSKTDSGTHPNGSIKTYGLGDLLRGTIYLHQMSVLHRFNFIVDIRGHPISQHLIVKDHPYMKYVDENRNKTAIKLVNCHENNSFKNVYNASLKSAAPLLICTNMYCNEQLSHECKQFMKQLLIPNEMFKTYLTEKNTLNKLSSDYPSSIVHFRLGDDEFCTTKPNDLSKMNHAMNMLKKYAGQSDIFITDSFRFKQFLIANNFNIKMFNTRPLHLGEISTLFKDDVSESFKETLYEFFTLSNSHKIKTYSAYDWVSGFVKFVSLIYDVPLVDLKPFHQQQQQKQQQQQQQQQQQKQQQQIQSRRQKHQIEMMRLIQSSNLKLIFIHKKINHRHSTSPCSFASFVKF